MPKSAQSVLDRDSHTLQSVGMKSPVNASLHPTLWRTCRVIANRSRLRILRLLVNDSPQTVSSVALRLNLSLPAASQYLRSLESRGLLTCRRVRRRVEYRIAVVDSDLPQRLIAAVRLAFRDGERAIDSLFNRATAFTHPRRVELFRMLTNRSLTIEQVRAATLISRPAVARHLGKLRVRGFVENRSGAWTAVIPHDACGRALAALAGQP
jgi:DNA-binding transcriptional ArsR family regulator